MSWVDAFIASMSAHHTPLNVAAKKAGVDRGAPERALRRQGMKGKNSLPSASVGGTPRRLSNGGARR
jgi:hypothetical protein